MDRLGIPHFDFVFSTTHTEKYLSQMAEVLRPFGGFGLIDDPGAVDVAPLKRKSIRIAWEFMFSKSMYGYKPETQGKILEQVTALVEERRMRSTAHSVLTGLSAANLRDAHERLERGTALGKIVITL